MHIRLSRQFIVDSLKNEKEGLLAPGTWIDSPRPDETFHGHPAPVTLDHCPRCGVGAVMFRALNHRLSADMIRSAATAATNESCITPDRLKLGTLYTDALQILEDRPMSALSYFFEGSFLRISVAKQKRRKEAQELGLPGVPYGYTKEETEEAVAATIAFVSTNFPDSVVVDINGAEPAEDIEVVSWVDVPGE